ncbi:bifunctional protein-disulfide isomerase/oxidoreductase DsbC [Testudinibacter sp. TR-2022]|uniref:bifunctional protein-disulfide isomerase/oxidoreductase DsbC n=1 Tax=Testudinibacter sp. TR-2022 TaxID=2585029 RepID=UPI001117F8E0|nr:bifunctional protein-disulfide isomerase/oxidoreductase DsbC [Testudinibacter sp. TR-2022]TNH08083.1 bifunctional protein-disulfide isomerase/oxidoreductase DsbC [Pasteurellaceae bacterium Phil11]TNH24573.1 bifunctional protein-disulfide isomerase/oxidoreductase DsbC [Testudinibacter sp. TR-2022]
MKKSILLATTLFSSLAFGSDAEINQHLSALGMTNIEVQPAPIKGIKSVVSDQGIFYVSEDGNYILRGDLFEFKNGELVNLSEKILFGKLNALSDQMIVYPAKNEKYVVTVFMDITCHYCHLLYSKKDEYNNLGITLRFLAFPRAGLDNQTARQMEAIWQAKDRNQALDAAENGDLPKNLMTPDIVAQHYALGRQYGVRGTPSIVTDSGEMIGGYLPPKELLAALQEAQ